MRAAGAALPLVCWSFMRMPPDATQASHGGRLQGLCKALGRNLKIGIQAVF